MHSQFPIPEWDEAYALTEGREVIDPRPMAETAIFRHYAPFMNGFVTYSEGVNDDVNKFIWSALGWSSHADPMETLREYARYFVVGADGGMNAESLAQGIASLEKNWAAPLLANRGVEVTLDRFIAMQRTATPAQTANWRFQEALYRSYTDAYERERLIAETARQQRAIEALRDAPQAGSVAAMQHAERVLDTGGEPEAENQLHTVIETLAGDLFDGIGLQLSVAKYHASATDRGASLDTVDVSLNDRVWLKNEFAKIRAMPSEADRLHALHAIANWENPGPGGFYDDLGNPSQEPHLVRGPGYPDDPALLQSALDGIADRTPDQGWRLSSISYAGALYDHPLEMRYTGLDTRAHYKLRIEYAGENYTTPVRLMANDQYEIHAPRLRRGNPEIAEFPVPSQATQGGTLDLKWTRPAGLGGGGRGFQVAEVWLIREK
jgi:hypothetical protein